MVIERVTGVGDLAVTGSATQHDTHGEDRGNGSASGPDIPVLPALSFTQLSAYQKCPKSFDLRYIQNMPQSESGAAKAGSAIHVAIEEAEEHEWWRDPDSAAILHRKVVVWDGPDTFHYETRSEPGPLAQAFLVAFGLLIAQGGGEAVQQWGGKALNVYDPVTNKPLTEKDPDTGKERNIKAREDLRWWVYNGPSMLRRYCAVRRADEEAGRIPATLVDTASGEVLSGPGGSVEVRVGVWLNVAEEPGEAQRSGPAQEEPEDSGDTAPGTYRPGRWRLPEDAPAGATLIRGTMDLFLLQDSDGTHIIRDWKSGTFVEEWQLANYAWMVKVKWGLDVRVGEIGYLRASESSGVIKRHVLTSRVPLVPVQYAEMARGIALRYFPTRPSNLCPSCWVREHCPVGSTYEERKD